MLYLWAAGFTIAAWAIQAYVTAIGKKNKITLFLPVLYAISCIMFMIEAIMAKDTLYIVLNIVLLVLLVIVAVSLLRIKKAA